MFQIRTVDKKSGAVSYENAGSKNVLLLAIAYAANIGGTGVIPGTPTNFVLINVSAFIRFKKKKT